MEERQSKRAKFTEASSSSTSETGNNYYVFLSFRGPDTRNGFVDHLYHKLQDVGLPFHPNFVFKDDEELPFGDNIGENLISAIEHSKVSIPVISENYAANEWCLRELIHIMECKESRGQIVLPVLYKVKPYEVRELKGAFGKAYKSRKNKCEEEVKQQGLLALKKAVGLRVFESEKFANGHEGELVRELVRVIMDERQHDFLPPLPRNLVEIDDRVAEVMKLADTNPSETRIIGIYGIGGIGKTTLATNIYNKLVKKFECRSFLMDIRETINRNGMEHIQNLLISDITRDHKSRVPDSVRGIVHIRSSCENKKVLILLDDVGHQEHIDKLIGGCNFKSGSRIIITCRDKALLNSEYKSYELEEMNSKNSILLFSSYAFEAKQPPADFMILSRDIVATTGGLPLALIVIGSLLNRKDKSIWTETLQKLRKIPHKDVQEKLKLSYNALDDDEKKMFLDIACFFIGIDKRIVAYLWKDLGLYPASGLARMIELSLIKYGGDNELRMHDQLRDLGRNIARSADKESWDRSRLWDEEAMNVSRREQENENIEALRLDKKGSREFMKPKSCRKMPNLKFLHIKDVDFDGNFKGSLAELRWLKWEKCPGSFKATNVHLEKLVVLDLSAYHFRTIDYISEKWRGWSSIKMERLKVLDLSWRSEFQRTPNLSAFKNLEMLILKRCDGLRKIHPSIGDVKHLVSLNLSHCENLEKLPKQLSELENLEELSVDETGIKEIPPCIGCLKQLKRLSAKWCWQLIEVLASSIEKPEELVELDLSQTRVKKLPEFIGELNKLKILRIDGSHIERLPRSIGKSQSLQELHAFECDELEGQILVDKGGLSSLKTLDLHGTKISGLPENLDQFSSLEHLDLCGCDELESLPKPHSSLSSLNLTCRSKELPSLSHLKHLQDLCLSSCRSLQSIPELPSCIQMLHVVRCPKLERLPNLFDLEFLSELWLVECNGPKKFIGLEALKSLRELLPKFFQGTELVLSNLNSFDEKPDDLHAIEGLEKLGSLEVVDISGRKHIQVLDLSKSEHLKKLFVTCRSNELPSLSHLKHLQELSLWDCGSLQSISELPSCIRMLHIVRCPKLKRLSNLSDLEFLSKLWLIKCNGLKTLDGLEALKSLRELCLSLDSDEKLDDLHAIEGLEKLGSLEEVEISACKHIRVLDLSKSEHLKRLYVGNCKSLVEIRCPSKFLEYFSRDGCEALKQLPDFLPHDELWLDRRKKMMGGRLILPVGRQ